MVQINGCEEYDPTYNHSFCTPRRIKPLKDFYNTNRNTQKENKIVIDVQRIAGECKTYTVKIWNAAIKGSLRYYRISEILLTKCVVNEWPSIATVLLVYPYNTRRLDVQSVPSIGEDPEQQLVCIPYSNGLQTKTRYEKNFNITQRISDTATELNRFSLHFDFNSFCRYLRKKNLSVQVRISRSTEGRGCSDRVLDITLTVFTEDASALYRLLCPQPGCVVNKDKLDRICQVRFEMRVCSSVFLDIVSNLLTRREWNCVTSADSEFSVCSDRFLPTRKGPYLVDTESRRSSDVNQTAVIAKIIVGNDETVKMTLYPRDKLEADKKLGIQQQPYSNTNSKLICPAQNHNRNIGDHRRRASLNFNDDISTYPSDKNAEKRNIRCIRSTDNRNGQTTGNAEVGKHERKKESLIPVLEHTGKRNSSNDNDDIAVRNRFINAKTVNEKNQSTGDSGVVEKLERKQEALSFVHQQRSISEYRKTAFSELQSSFGNKTLSHIENPSEAKFTELALRVECNEDSQNSQDAKTSASDIERQTNAYSSEYIDIHTTQSAANHASESHQNTCTQATYQVLLIKVVPGTNRSTVEFLEQIGNNSPVVHCGVIKNPLLQSCITNGQLRYIRGQLIGQGAYGKVYICYAIDISNGRNLQQVQFIAKRILRTRFKATEVTVNMEYGNTMPGILSYFGVIAEERYVTVLMEFYEGKTLKEFLSCPSTMFDLKDVIVIFYKLLQIVKTLHERNIVHNDIKAANIMMRQLSPGNFEVKLIDFGLAIRLSSMIRSNSITNETLCSPNVEETMVTEERDMKKRDSNCLGHVFSNLLDNCRINDDHKRQLANSLYVLLTESDPHRRISVARAMLHPLFDDIRWQELLFGGQWIL